MEKGSQSSLLGLVYDVPTLFINEVQRGLLSVCGAAGYDVVVHPCEYGKPRLLDNIRQFVTRTRIDGVIVLPPVSELRGLGSSLDELGVPHVRFAVDETAEIWRTVVTDYDPAVSAMADHLAELGHRLVGFISGPAGNKPSAKRQEAFERALARHGIKLRKEFIVEGDFTYASGLRAGGELLSSAIRPTAVFAANDDMAVALMNVAATFGISVPDELSVVGFDGTAFSTFVSPTLTTILRPSEEMASLAARKLLAMIQEGRLAALKYDTRVSPRFVARESTARAPAGTG